MRPYQHLMGVAAFVVCLTPTIGNATGYNFFWTGNSALDGTIVSSSDNSLQATGTIDINAGAGASFTLSDIVSTNITVSGAGIASFVFTTWTQAGGTISADGLSATFSDTGNPFFDTLPSSPRNFFGCHFFGCGVLPGAMFDILAGQIPSAEEHVFYDTAQDALASMHMTVAASETPLPDTLPLFTTGLGALGLLGWRRKRKAN